MHEHDFSPELKKYLDDVEIIAHKRGLDGSADYIIDFVNFDFRYNEHSIYPCDVCHSKLHGERYGVICMNKDKEILKLQCCNNCRLYISNAELPDL